MVVPAAGALSLGCPMRLRPPNQLADRTPARRELAGAGEPAEPPGPAGARERLPMMAVDGGALRPLRPS